ncbi:MAG: AAA domain-containing protein [Cytophagales bacterium]|nr:AAA domain-containing protein [Cytophagales bacterium]
MAKKAEQKKRHNYTFYGQKANAEELHDFMKHVFKTNEEAEAEGRRKTPVCIWGTHGIGKTHNVEQIAKDNGYKFTYIAPAQFEEMGDLLGMPKIVERDGEMVTEMMAPDWVPTEEGPGILLIDDVNRADIRILRGIMQLLQNFELVSWKLPKGWQMVLTANPDGGDYSVTPMDGAMLTRMLHVTMEFDVKQWALWAEQNGVDERGINFVLTYPELVTGERTTPRSLVQFFETLKPIKNLEENLGLVAMLAHSCFERETVTAFMTFIQNNLSKLISPEEILNAKKFELEVQAQVKGLVQKGDTKRVDILSVLCTRVVNYIKTNDIKLKADQVKNVKQFIKMDLLPNDMRLIMAQDLIKINASTKMIMADPEIGKLLLKKM